MAVGINVATAPSELAKSKVFGSKSMKIYFYDNLTPLKITASFDGVDFSHILMPMKA